MRHLPGRRVVFLLVATGLAAAALAQGQQPTIRIVRPETGTVVESSDVHVQMQVTGVELTPRRSSNAAHVLLRMDDKPPVKSYNDEFTFQDVAPGNHVVRAELRRGNGSAFRPPARTQVRFSVRPRQP